MSFNFITYMSDEGIKSKKGPGDEYILECIACHKEKHLYYNVQNNYWICHHCDERGNYIGFIMLHQGVSYEEAIEIVEGFAGIKLSRIRQRIKSYLTSMDSKIDYNKHKMIMQPPLHAKRLTDKFYPTFFNKRKYDKEIVLRLNPLVCEKGLYENRIIFPFTCDGNKSFIAYAINKYIKPKVLDPIGSDNKDLVFGYDFWKTVNRVFLVEGVMDLLRLLHHGLPAIALLWKNISNSQMYFLDSFPSEEIVLFLDGDVGIDEVLKKAVILSENISKKVLIAFIEDEVEDPDSLSSKDFKKTIEKVKTIRQFKNYKMINSFLHN